MQGRVVTRATWLFIIPFVLLMVSITPETYSAELSPDQKELMERYDYPDSFTLIMATDSEDDDGFTLRIESWNYYRENKSFVFHNGEIESIMDLEDLPDGMVLPVIYRPESFRAGMTREEVLDEIIGDGDFEFFMLPEDEDLPDIDLVGAEQLLMGFDGKELVFVRTIPVPLMLDEHEKEGEEVE